MGKKGCWIIGCGTLGVIALLIISAIFGSYYVLMHTAWPAKKVCEMIEEETGAEISGITGSLSSGFTVQKVRFKDNKGNLNEIDDIGFSYETRGDIYVIKDIHVARAHFYIDDDGSINTGNEDNFNLGNESDNWEQNQKSFPQIGGPKSSAYSPPPTSPLDNLQLIVESIDIKNITFENVTTGIAVKLDKIFLDGFESTKADGLKMGKLIIESNYCSLQVIPTNPEIGRDTNFKISGLLKEKIHKSILKDIDIKGKLAFDANKLKQLQLEACDGKLKVNVLNDGEKVSSQITDFTPRDYLRDAFCISKINVKIQEENNPVKNYSGNFMIGRGKFIIKQSKLSGKKGFDNNHRGVCKTKSVTYYCTISDQLKNSIFPQIKLSSDPKMPSKDILSLLLFNKKHNQLNSKQKKKIKRELKYCK